MPIPPPTALPSDDVVRTHSGVWPTVAAVAATEIFQPPRGMRLPKKESRLPFTDTVMDLPSSDCVAVAVTVIRRSTPFNCFMAKSAVRSVTPVVLMTPSCFAPSRAAASAASCSARRSDTTDARSIEPQPRTATTGSRMAKAMAVPPRRFAQSLASWPAQDGLRTCLTLSPTP
jgi:hypothetical protein